MEEGQEKLHYDARVFLRVYLGLKEAITFLLLKAFFKGDTFKREDWIAFDEKVWPVYQSGREKEKEKPFNVQIQLTMDKWTC